MLLSVQRVLLLVPLQRVLLLVPLQRLYASPVRREVKEVSYAELFVVVDAEV